MLLGIAVAVAPQDSQAFPVQEHVGEATASPSELISTSLEAALTILDESGAEGSTIVAAIHGANTIVAFEDELPPQFTAGGSAARYYPVENVISIGMDYRSADLHTLGAILAHEGTHVLDDRILNKPGSALDAEGAFEPYSCLARELDAFGAAVRYWDSIYPPTADNPRGGKPVVTNPVEMDNNNLLHAKSAQEENRQVRGIISRYLAPGSGCSMQKLPVDN